MNKTKLITGVVIAAEDRNAVVEQEQDQNEKQRDADGGPADPVNGVGLAGEENAIDEGAAIGGEELDREEQDDGEQEKPYRTQKLGYELGYGLAGVADDERNQHHDADDHCQ